MKRDPRLYLDDILLSIKLIEEYLNGITEEEFKNSIAIQDMIIRRLEIIGEATKNLSMEFRERYPDVQ